MQRLSKLAFGVLGAGRVYEAVLRGPGGFTMPVALEVLRRGAAALQREARIGGLLRHRNLVDVYEVARRHADAALALGQRVGDRSLQLQALGQLVGLERSAGRLDAASRQEEAMQAIRAELEIP